MDFAPGQILSCKPLNRFPVRHDIFFHDDKLLAGRAEKIFPKLEMACVTSDFAGRQRSPDIPDGTLRRIAQRFPVSRQGERDLPQPSTRRSNAQYGLVSEAQDCDH
jgi:hypothetical protein